MTIADIYYFVTSRCHISSVFIWTKRNLSFMPVGRKSHAHFKQFKLTGNSLELHTLTYRSDTDKGVANYNDIVKEMKIGKSAAKLDKWDSMC